MAGKKKQLGDLAGPSKASLGYTQKMQESYWQDVQCRVCGIKYRKHGSDIKDMRRHGRNPICRECAHKEKVDIAKAIVNIERRKKACQGIARKMTLKMRLKNK